MRSKDSFEHYFFRQQFDNLTQVILKYKKQRIFSHWIWSNLSIPLDFSQFTKLMTNQYFLNEIMKINSHLHFFFFFYHLLNVFFCIIAREISMCSY